MLNGGINSGIDVAAFGLCVASTLIDQKAAVSTASENDVVGRRAGNTTNNAKLQEWDGPTEIPQDSRYAKVSIKPSRVWMKEIAKEVERDTKAAKRREKVTKKPGETQRDKLSHQPNGWSCQPESLPSCRVRRYPLRISEINLASAIRRSTRGCF